MKNQAQLITYVDRLSAGTFRDLQALLDGPLNGVFGGVHVLPFFHPIDGADAGFDPIDHTQVDARLGSWDDVRLLASRTEVMADVIVNHISSGSPQFRDYDERGSASPYAGMFLTFGRVFPDGARESDLLKLHTPKPQLPFAPYYTAQGHEVLLWTTFTSEQIDIDVHDAEARRYLSSVLGRFQAAGIQAIRLDAVGFTIKKPGTSCFMLPETLAFIDEFTAEANAGGMDVLVEVHGHHQDHITVASHVDWVYDFSLPPLVLHTLYTRDAAALEHWIGMRPRNMVTVLDTHDGIGVRDVAPDADRGLPTALLDTDSIRLVVETIHERCGGGSLEASGAAASNVDAHHINCTFYDALGRRDDEYLAARAIQCFVPGVPQIYYVGLLAGTNDMDLLRRTRVGRDINRHYYTPDEVRRELRRPVVRSLVALLRFRNTHPAFQGSFELLASPEDRLVMKWSNGEDHAQLDVDLIHMTASVSATQTAGAESIVRWRSSELSELL